MHNLGQGYTSGINIMMLANPIPTSEGGWMLHSQVSLRLVPVLNLQDGKADAHVSRPRFTFGKPIMLLLVGNVKILFRWLETIHRPCAAEFLVSFNSFLNYMLWFCLCFSFKGAICRSNNTNDQKKIWF